MQSQKSAETGGAKLFLVGTPIGNLEDMTFRAIRVLQEADIIAAEDTRNTIKLCNHFDIKTPLISYHEHNLEKGGEKILSLLAEGKQVALVSDAGMPCISDPGYDIAVKAIEDGYDVVPIPGANAAISALVASGIQTQPFSFFGFLSRQKKERNEQLRKLKQKEETLIFYEAPHRLKETIRSIADAFGTTRRVVLARELTKRYEEFLRGTLEEAVLWVETNELRGEFCIILEGNEDGEEDQEESWWKDISVFSHVELLMEKEQIPSKEAIRLVALERGIAKRDVYQEYHVNE
ncbi:16S rRNA (cytidine(1402)-2'-O)-methyltransferase [Sporosarcina thermotolerans]|uniref:Ribosomal RNA small subunit methyltransferase I n=1 Tax=Sporosarcina thermotolerans TaxID=633404 RepID=A0AAW9ADK3_9BACL|nr:16S rRNA (cytidine(1402)-2'-O)-methyltransferase [Sporosarcina thermotolerans]MDW0118673.1 16S rRNA (cytidine(1402)-2'-O)-methyltransferase [Sporosarcina thermotolerans]WHT48674.1 16S rRNA (cytidine(1402)-2'-O)-methyltransferase [Sporosarcina thermotolerans]